MTPERERDAAARVADLDMQGCTISKLREWLIKNLDEHASAAISEATAAKDAECLQAAEDIRTLTDDRDAWQAHAEAAERDVKVLVQACEKLRMSGDALAVRLEECRETLRSVEWIVSGEWHKCPSCLAPKGGINFTHFHGCRLAACLRDKPTTETQP